MARSGRLATLENEFQRVLQERSLRTVFQPVVSVESRAIVGYEGLIRGPTGSVLESPDALIKEAYRENRVVEFDWIARASTSRAALAASLGPDDLLLLNIEPLALSSKCPPDLWPVIEEAFHKFRVVLEVTERSLDHDPHTLLDGIDRQRKTVSGLALDDVGADVRSVSMLPVLQPDVIKLDLKVTQGSPGAGVMKIVHMAYEEMERTGATILAEGVETEQQHDVVAELGAPLAQGWLYGRPTDDPTPTEEHEVHKRLGLDVTLDELHTPFEALRGQTISHASAELLVSLCNEVFVHGLHLLSPAMVIMLDPGPDLLDPNALRVLARLARRGVVAGALGPGLPSEPAPGVRGSWEHDPLLDGQLAVIALSPSTAVAILAQRMPGTDSQFQFGVIHDRQRIISAARCLLRRLGPRPRKH
jgi:EAL domain-containing protein (putative c-di-GMP-specific phosphodiesterase class I)